MKTLRVLHYILLHLLIQVHSELTKIILNKSVHYLHLVKLLCQIG